VLDALARQMSGNRRAAVAVLLLVCQQRRGRRHFLRRMRQVGKLQHLLSPGLLAVKFFSCLTWRSSSVLRFFRLTRWSV
jgi:hypothetical protein